MSLDEGEAIGFSSCYSSSDTFFPGIYIYILYIYIYTYFVRGTGPVRFLDFLALKTPMICLHHSTDESSSHFTS